MKKREEKPSKKGRNKDYCLSKREVNTSNDSPCQKMEEVVVGASIELAISGGMAREVHSSCLKVVAGLL